MRSVKAVVLFIFNPVRVNWIRFYDLRKSLKSKFLQAITAVSIAIIKITTVTAGILGLSTTGWATESGFEQVCTVG